MAGGANYSNKLPLTNSRVENCTKKEEKSVFLSFFTHEGKTSVSATGGHFPRIVQYHNNPATVKINVTGKQTNHRKALQPERNRKSMLKMNGRARPAPISEDPVIQALSCQPVGAIFNDTELYGELQAIKNHVRTLKHPVGFLGYCNICLCAGCYLREARGTAKEEGSHS